MDYKHGITVRNRINLLTSSRLPFGGLPKMGNTTQKNMDSTHKGEFTTQKRPNPTRKKENSTQKKILEYLRVHPQATRLEVSKALGDITEDGVKYSIARLQEKGLLGRVGGRKQGEWIVKDKND